MKLRKQKKAESLRAKRIKTNELQIDPPEAYLASIHSVFGDPKASIVIDFESIEIKIGDSS